MISPRSHNALLSQSPLAFRLTYASCTVMKPVGHSLAVTEGAGSSVTFSVPAATYCAKVAIGIVMIAVFTPPLVALEQFTAPV